MSWNNPTPVVVALIRTFDGDDHEASGLRLIAIERGIEPQVGGLAFPGGYVDEGEDAETAIAREIQEELNWTISPGLFRPLTTRITPTNRLLIFMRCICPPSLIDYQIRQGELVFKPNKEARSLRLVTVGDTLCFPTHQSVLEHRLLWE